MWRTHAGLLLPVVRGCDAGRERGRPRDLSVRLLHARCRTCQPWQVGPSVASLAGAAGSRMNTFTVGIETPAGPLSLGRDTAEAAIETGRTMQREGVGAVFITPPGGTPQP